MAMIGGAVGGVTVVGLFTTLVYAALGGVVGAIFGLVTKMIWFKFFPKKK
jgi:hypothetical protein